MPSSPPRRVQVGPYRLALIVDTKRLDEEAVECGKRRGEFAGRTNVADGTIYLRDDLAPDYAAETLLHELMHACFVTVGDPLNDEAEEQACSALAATLLDTLRRQPRLLAYLIDPA